MPTRLTRKKPSTTKKFYDPARDGVTFSLLSTFLTCRQKARLFLHGYSGQHLSFAIVFGNIAHKILQVAYDQHRTGSLKQLPTSEWVDAQLEKIYRRWQRDNPRPNETAVQIMEEAMMKAGVLMPWYFHYWARDDFQKTNWMQVEETFRVPYSVTTKDGRVLETFLRGRMDAAFRRPQSKRPLDPRLFESKTRSTVDEQNLIDTLPIERQPGLYLSVLRRLTGREPASVTLNIIRKPLLRQKQKESWAQFERRIYADVKSRLDWYFFRMEMTVDPQDINRAEEDLNDLVSDFLLWWNGQSGHYKNSSACIQPYGKCPYLGYCSRGEMHGLIKRDVVFRELEDE